LSLPPKEHSFLISDIIIADSQQKSRQMFRNFRFPILKNGLSIFGAFFASFSLLSVLNNAVIRRHRPNKRGLCCQKKEQEFVKTADWESFQNA